MKNKEDTIHKINQAIEQLRPFLHADGGDMEFVELTKDSVQEHTARCAASLWRFRKSM